MPLLTELTHCPWFLKPNFCQPPSLHSSLLAGDDIGEAWPPVFVLTFVLVLLVPLLRGLLRR